MLTKKKLLSSIRELPDVFTLDEVIDHLVLMQKIEKGLQQSAEGKTISLTEARKRLKKWSK